jgi:hypothetical protein
MNKHLINNKKNLFRGITGLAVAGLAGGFMSAGSVAAAGTEICMEPGANGIPRIVECPPTFTLTPLPGLGAPEVNLGGDIDYGAILDYVNNRDNNDSDDTSGDSGFGGVEIPSADDLVDPDRFAPLEPNLDVFEQDNPFLGIDDDAEPELAQPEAEAQPEAQPEIEAQPEPQPEVQPEVEVQPEAQPEVQPETDSTGVGVTEVAPEETTDTETTEAVTTEAVTPEAVAPQVTTRVVAPTVNIPNNDSTDTNVDADVDREIIEAAPVEVLTTDDTTTGGANLGLYAGILLILGGGGSLAAIAATRRNRD